MYLVIFKTEEAPRQWKIQKYSVKWVEALKLWNELSECGNVVATKILKIDVFAEMDITTSNKRNKNEN